MTAGVDAPRVILETLWRALGDGARAVPAVDFVGGFGGLPSVYSVDALAAATVGVATAATAELLAVREGGARRDVVVERGHAAAAFRSERYLELLGTAPMAAWDPLAGDYAAADGWIRIHTNYAHHRAAALRALGVERNRDAVAKEVATRSAEELESAIVKEGGAAAKMRTTAEWAEHPQGRAVAGEPLVATTLSAPLGAGARRLAALSGDAMPLAGIRVLDLTRVIAGPVCTRVLAAHGADVLRIDPPGFEEVGALLGDTTAGKRRAFLDLRTAEGRGTFERLAATADVLVCGYRGNALDGLGLGADRLRAANPALAIVNLDAYGWTGPWRDRRGFDSLVQMSTGIAARSAEAMKLDVPGALPAQALDHGSGYLLAAVVCRALTRRCEDDVASTAHFSLARLARLLVDLGDDGDAHAPAIASGDPWREREESGFGPLLRVRCPGRIAGVTPRWARPAGPLGVDSPAWGD